MDVRLSDDLSEPVYFVSYARATRAGTIGPGREPNRYVRDLFDELADNVNELIGSPAGAGPGFIDLARGAGTRWEREILRAAGTCQVLVCLLSPKYLSGSAWCAREWHVFERRQVYRRDSGEPATVHSAIIPVLWTPILGRPPRAVGSVNIFEPAGLPEESQVLTRYWTDGLRGLLKTGRDIYEAVVWKLALQVRHVYATYRVEPNVPESLDGLRTSFTED